MIKIDYYCDETDQHMQVLVETDGDKSEVTFVFEPRVSSKTVDPGGVMSRILAALTNKERTH